MDLFSTTSNIACFHSRVSNTALTTIIPSFCNQFIFVEAVNDEKIIICDDIEGADKFSCKWLHIMIGIVVISIAAICQLFTTLFDWQKIILS